MGIYKEKDDKGNEILLNTDEALEKWVKRQGGEISWLGRLGLWWEHLIISSTIPSLISSPQWRQPIG
jgi:hypothetical protein